MEITMEAAQDQELNQIIRGKRTKRQRLMSPLTLAITCSSSSGPGDQIEEEEEGENSGFMTDNNTEEEEDMAYCLILLAQGSHHNRKSPSEISTTTTTSDFKVAGLDAYQCKTCDRCFSSFQALGGHRASHKKLPKAVNIEEDTILVCAENQLNKTSTSLFLQTGINKRGTLCKSNYKVHECSVCGAEFSSGQALGGHMRRHRTIVNGGGSGGPSTTLSLDSSSHQESHHEAKKPRTNTSTNLQLDLNLRAADEDIDGDCDRKEVNFRFGSKEKIIVFSASPLVDCHY